MGYDGGDIDAGVEEVGHLVPGLVHLAAVDAFDGDHVKDDGLPVDGELFGRDAEEGDLSAVEHIGEHVLESDGHAGHFHPDVEAFLHAQFLLDVLDRGLAYINGTRDVAHLLGKLEPEWVDVRDNDVACTGVFCDRGGHYADRAGSGDEHVLAEDLEFERGVDGVAEWVEDRRNVEVNARLVLPDVRVRHGDELGKTAVGVYADSGRIGTECPLPRHAVAAAAADQMALDADDIAGLEIDNVRAHIDDLADEFVADGRRDVDRGLRPGVPVVNVEVCATDAAAFYADHHIIDAHFGHRHIFDPKTGLGLALYDSFHKL